MRPTRRFEFCPSGDHFGNNAPFSDSCGRETLHGIRRKTGIGGLIPTCVAIAGCGGPQEPAPAPFLPPPVAAANGCGDSGYLRTTLYGAYEGEIDWSDGELDCEGMPRPDDEGARLRFAGTAADGLHSLAFIIAIPALERGATASELASNVTMIEEGNGRFFSTPGLESCWVDIGAQTSVEDTESTYMISGTLYCITPLPEVNGESSVMLREVDFAGLLDWSAQ